MSKFITMTIVGRETEYQKIKKFLKNDEHILHISGNPGTGKTFTVKSILNNQKYTYVNFYNHKIPHSFKHIVVFDEFDKFKKYKNSQIKICLIKLKERNKKIITISNFITDSENMLHFAPYDQKKIKIILENILRQKSDIIDYISKKYSKKGDFREIEGLLKKYNNFLNMTVMDLFEENKENIHNIHHDIISDIIQNNSDKYSDYIELCKQYKIEPMSRADFLLIYENMI